MSASHDTYTRKQGLKKTYDVEYTSLHYKISLDGKLLKDMQLPMEVVVAKGSEATWKTAVEDIEYLRGMDEI